MSTPRAPNMVRASQGTPLVLLHGITCSASVWQSVLPQLAAHHDVLAFNALGHRQGHECTVRPARIQHVVDDAERTLDQLGLQRAHLAGNSMGGWVALELARRGRALSVCALSPAGAWETLGRPSRKLHTVDALTRATRPILPLLSHLPLFRRLALRDNAAHGERVSQAAFMQLVDDLIACRVTDDLLATHESLQPLEASCPVTIAWSEHDAIFPLHRHAPVARRRVPHARFLVLPDVGHVPMLDDPQLVADTILESTRAAQPQRGDTSLTSS